MKVALQRERITDNGGMSSMAITFALPFYKSGSGRYVHRVRSGCHHTDKRTGEYSHTHFSMWCGFHGFTGKEKNGRIKGELFAEAPENSVFCAVCEGKAIGAGQAGPRRINGRFVSFVPRV